MCFLWVRDDFSSWGDQKCELGTFVTPSLSKEALSLNNIFVQITWLPMSQWQHFSRAKRSFGCRAWTFWMWTGWRPNSCPVLHAVAWGVPSRLAIFRMMLLELRCPISSTSPSTWAARLFFVRQLQFVRYSGTHSWTVAYVALYDQEITVDALQPLLVYRHNKMPYTYIM
jgi:hypothetical protein